MASVESCGPGPTCIPVRSAGSGNLIRRDLGTFAAGRADSERWHTPAGESGQYSRQPSAGPSFSPGRSSSPYRPGKRRTHDTAPCRERMSTVEFRGETIECDEGVVLRDVLLDAGLTPHNGTADALNCRGHGTCGTCAVAVEGTANDRTDAERRRLSLPPHSVDGRLRLSCQTRVEGDLTVTKHDGFFGQKVPDGDRVCHRPLGGRRRRDLRGRGDAPECGTARRHAGPVLGTAPDSAAASRRTASSDPTCGQLAAARETHRRRHLSVRRRRTRARCLRGDRREPHPRRHR